MQVSFGIVCAQARSNERQSGKIPEDECTSSAAATAVEKNARREEIENKSQNSTYMHCEW